ncbi:hypothetical protein PBY51_024492 [Eleginops maclovinus]|uniref:Uncharacterized protein n=1 Tax=Eleginops maclovinus TaxID=56733 RepID=A0AAN8AW03_ELEMC|nr:hypothetical protein PBY51_024492 [Eleginops maclovinus]
MEGSAALLKQTGAPIRELIGQFGGCEACGRGRGLGEVLAGLEDQRVMRWWSMTGQTVLSRLDGGSR